MSNKSPSKIERERLRAIQHQFEIELQAQEEISLLEAEALYEKYDELFDDFINLLDELENFMDVPISWYPEL